jgi:hypothetical protein
MPKHAGFDAVNTTTLHPMTAVTERQLTGLPFINPERPSPRLIAFQYRH